MAMQSAAIRASNRSTVALESAVEELERRSEQLDNENLALRGEVDRISMFDELVGTSPALRAVHSQAVKVAATDSTVLVTGETGTGKELLARAIHRRSGRAARPFVGVNCAAIPNDLVASELFGHEKGAFTGATQRRLGRFELASGGTIFLDEVGELPMETQVALLRVLQEHEFERVGGNCRIGTNVRVIAATNRDLQARIGSGAFRSDLFYRLNVFPIEMPSLHERRTDIPLLVEYFIDRFARKAGKRFTACSGCSIAGSNQIAVRCKLRLSAVRQKRQNTGILCDRLRIRIGTLARCRYQKAQNPDCAFMRVASARYLEHR